MSLLFPDEKERLAMVIYMPYEPEVSVNRCYGINPLTKQRYLKLRPRAWKETAKMMLRERLAIENIEFSSDRLQISLNARFPLKRGQKPDASNFFKLFEDAIAEELGIDDHNFTSGGSVVSHLRENGDGLLIYTIEEYERN